MATRDEILEAKQRALTQARKLGYTSAEDWDMIVDLISSNVALGMQFLSHPEAVVTSVVRFLETGTLQQSHIFNPDSIPDFMVEPGARPAPEFNYCPIPDESDSLRLHGLGVRW